jgi:hypothetical protein
MGGNPRYTSKGVCPYSGKFMKNTKIDILRIAAASLLLASSALLALPASAADNQPENSKFVLISFDENFTNCAPGEAGPGCIDGTTTLAGAFSDKGSRHQDNTVVSASKDGKQVVVTGKVRISGSKGILFTKYTGTIQFDGTTNIAYIEGTESITGGTGVYLGAAGKGTFEATIDFDTGNIVGVAELQLKK